MKKLKKSIEIDGRTLTLETGHMAAQANAAVLARYGDTMVLAAVVCAPQREELSYFPLSVEYFERLYAGGRIKGSRWVKREGRPSDEAILIARFVDRSIRPLFPNDYKDEVQVTITVLSVDSENDPGILSAVATSAALAISDIPWQGPIGTVRVGLKEGVPFINPVENELAFSDLNLIISVLDNKVIMLEGSAKQVPEEQFLTAVEFGCQQASQIIKLIGTLQKEAGVKKQVFATLPESKLVPQAKKFLRGKLKEADFKTLLDAFTEKQPPQTNKTEIQKAFDQAFSEEMRKVILSGKRIDGRKPDQIRPLDIEVGLLPRTHGSALFKRGETQALTVTTLGSPSLEQLIESPIGEESKRYIHHYAMPPFSLGNVGRVGWPSRREIGHGALAEKALEPVIPPEEKFPYTIRVVSEVLSSNGSTSMASVCGSSLSLMDAGVPIVAPVAGIAMGLIVNEKLKMKNKQSLISSENEKLGAKDYVILSDITGVEDFNGDMDLKIAGSRQGITAIQLDVKINGLTCEMIKNILAQAKVGQEHIFDEMLKVLAKPRPKISQYAPKVAVLHLPIEKIGGVIGPGGRTIRKIIEETGCAIDIEDDGAVNISGTDEESVSKAIARVEGLTKEINVGDTYEGEVKRIQPFGAFVEILPGREGLVHVSQMAPGYVADPNQVVSVGQKVNVRVLDAEQGKVSLSMLSGAQAAQKRITRTKTHRRPVKRYPPSRTRKTSPYPRPTPSYRPVSKPPRW